MNIVVYAHSMEVGGSQFNAIEIGQATQSLGHNVLLLAEDGALSPIVEKAGLEHIRVSTHRTRPSPGVMSSLTRLVEQRGIDIVHGYEWPPAVDAWLGPHRVLGTPVIATVMSAAVAPFLPRSMPLVVGVELLRRQCLVDGFQSVGLIEPPVDVHANSPEFDGLGFRLGLQLAPDAMLIVVVCRLVRELKLEGLLVACRTVGRLASEGRNIHLAIVGDGPARSEVEAAAGAVNAMAGNAVVSLLGELQDPRPAYAAADIVLGMGGSALRGLAFGKPLIVQGEAGFWKLCDLTTVSQFLEAGWYGLASGGDGSDALRSALEPLMDNPALRHSLGAFGRKLIVDRFSLESAARTQVSHYETAISLSARAKATEIARVSWGVGRHYVRRRLARALRLPTPADDFNALDRQHRKN
ncbi:MAG: glycosyltransferase family 4 protein [Alphaproteobacteria bacterium]|nr:glycosyltransferase family 4 protein [Alphaproteobacteria bacterium]MBU1561636.1 glycosyltransferase family 4 protein [Alphaproteobacteria bacterium]MBU2302383.1 glycosyltransferase family 4 protein [Alphaproteobacteria bacterium]MBU2368663.1 glycosyltransferase family 4 protein [Alphaproteobacteria bacterium]